MAIKNLKSLLLLRIGCKRLGVLCKLEIHLAAFSFNGLYKLRRDAIISGSNGNWAIGSHRSFLKKKRYLFGSFGWYSSCLLPL